MEGPQASKRVSRQKANRDTKMDTEAEAPCHTLTFESSLLVMVWRGLRSRLAREPALCSFLATRLESVLLIPQFCPHRSGTVMERQ